VWRAARWNCGSGGRFFLPLDAFTRNHPMTELAYPRSRDIIEPFALPLALQRSRPRHSRAPFPGHYVGWPSVPTAHRIKFDPAVVAA